MKRSEFDRLTESCDHERIEHVDFAVTAMVEPNVTFDSGNTAYPENLNFEQLNHLWGVLGGAYFPSVLYKVRLVKIRSDADMPAPEISPS